jgi:hypothetical protein
MSNYNVIYRKFVDDKNIITANRMSRGKFYLIKEYEYIDGEKGRFTETSAPIVFTLFVSKKKDIIHCIKVSNVNPNLIKRFFGKLINEETEMLQMRGNAKQIYQKTLSKMPYITNDSYRTYKISGLRKVLELNMDVNQITPKNKNVVGIDIKSQKRNI